MDVTPMTRGGSRDVGAAAPTGEDDLAERVGALLTAVRSLAASLDETGAELERQLARSSTATRPARPPVPEQSTTVAQAAAATGCAPDAQPGTERGGLAQPVPLRPRRHASQGLHGGQPPASQPSGMHPGAARHAVHPAQAELEHAALTEAVENRAVIEQAKGMLMLEHGCDADAAFGMLVELSRRERRKVRDIATDMIRAGSRPRRVIDVTDAVVRSGAVARPGALP